MTMNAGNPAAEAVGSAGATTDEVQSPLESTNTQELQQDAEGSEADSKEQSGELTDDDLAALEEGDDLEVEHQGKKLKVPKDLKPLVMMQQDYTRKTQELGESRRTFEAERKRQSELVQAATKTVTERAQLAAIDQRIEELQKTEAEFQQVNWDALFSSPNPEDQQNYHRLRHNHDQLRRQMEQMFGKRHGLANQIQQTEQQHIAAQRTEFAKRQNDARKVIESQIPGWNTERDAQMVSGAGEFYGLTREQLLAASADPSLYRVVWDAVQLRTLLKARASKPKPSVKPADDVTPMPAAKVSKGGPSGQSGPNDKQSADEWLRARNEQLARRARAR